MLTMKSLKTCMMIIKNVNLSLTKIFQALFLMNEKKEINRVMNTTIALICPCNHMLELPKIHKQINLSLAKTKINHQTCITQFLQVANLKIEF